MASASLGRIALLPFQPRYAHLIMKGKKKIEFRKVRFRNELSHVVMYISNPVRKVFGYFDVSHIDEGSPKKLWARYSVRGGILKEEFQAYYGSSCRGIAIGIGKVHILQNPIPLKTLSKSLSAPQGFAYLTTEVFQIIQDSNY